MAKVSIRNILCGFFIFGVGLIAILGLLAPLVSITTNVARATENGFDLFTMKSPLFFVDRQSDDELLNGAVCAIGAVSIAQCVAGASAVVLGIGMIFLPRLRIPALCVAGAALAFTIAYTVLGVVYTETFLDVAAEGGGDLGTITAQVGKEALSDAVTLAYIPLIVAAIVYTFACLSAFLKVRASSFLRLAAPRVSQGAGASLSDAERLDLLRTYARLRDEGILTAEEFEAKKKTLLKQ